MPLTWKERLQPATFDGVPFLAITHNLEVGRRASVQEFPQRDRPYVEDLGRKARRFRMSVVVLGDDYMDRRDALLKTCQARSSGFPKTVGKTLAHPYLGDVLVFCTSCRLTETVPEGRMARFELEFVESGDLASPKKVTTAAAATVAAASEVAAQSEAAAEVALDAGGSESVRAAISGALSTLGQTMQRLDIFSGPAAAVAGLGDDVQDMIDNAVGLATSPANAVSAVRQAIAGIAGSVSNAAGAIAAYETLFGYEAVQIGGKGGTGKKADQNARALAAQIREQAVAELAAVLATAEWESREQALESRDDLIAKIEELLETEDPELQVTLARVLALAGASIPPTNQRLPRLLEVTLRRDSPSLVLAYTLYDDAERDQELADRARARRPGFVPGGVPIAVLSDA